MAVGDPAKFDEERRKSRRGEVGPVFWETDRRDAADCRFCKEGRDFLRWSRRELVLGERLGEGVLTEGRGEASWGDKREGDAGSGVAEAFANVRRFKESERSQ